MSFGVVAEAAGVGVVQGVGEGGEGGVAADGVEEEGDGGALAFAGGLGQVFDGGLEDGKVADEGVAGGVGCGVVLGRGGLDQEGLKPLGVEALGIDAVAEGVGVAWLGAAAWGWFRFFVGTNRGRIGHGAEVLQFPFGSGRQLAGGHCHGPSRGGVGSLTFGQCGFSLGIGFRGCQAGCDIARAFSFSDTAG